MRNQYIQRRNTINHLKQKMKDSGLTLEETKQLRRLMHDDNAIRDSILHKPRRTELQELSLRFSEGIATEKEVERLIELVDAELGR
jgi:hypothetical protein